MYRCYTMQVKPGLSEYRNSDGKCILVMYFLHVGLFVLCAILCTMFRLGKVQTLYIVQSKYYNAVTMWGTLPRGILTNVITYTGTQHADVGRISRKTVGSCNQFSFFCYIRATPQDHHYLERCTLTKTYVISGVTFLYGHNILPA